MAAELGKSNASKYSAAAVTAQPEQVLEQAAIVAEAAGPSVERLPVREHLRPQPPKPRQSWPGLEIALGCVRKPDRNPDGWCWEPAYAVPAAYAEAFRTEGNA